MAYYSALITAWNLSSASSGALPSGVAGTSLFGLSTAAKLGALNAWEVSGVVPTTLYFTGAQLLNCINWAEFAALTAAQQANLLALCSNSGELLGGSANTAFLPVGMILAYFTNHSGPTITALIALAQASSQPWWQYAGYPGLFNSNDLAIAGLS